MTIGDKIRELRKNKNISQEELAFQLDVSRQTIHKWESSTTQPNADKLKVLCDFFNVSPNFFLTEEDKDLKDECAIAQVEKKSKRKIIVYSIVFSMTGLSFLISVLVTIGIGYIVFSDNFGHVMVSMLVMENYVFYLFLALSLILLLINLLLIVYLRKK